MYQKRSQHDLAMKDLQKAHDIIDEQGSNRDKAETQLIWGVIMQHAELRSEALEKYLEAEKYFKDYPEDPGCFYTSMNLAINSLSGQEYLEKAEEYLREYGTRYNWALYYYGIKGDKAQWKENLLKSLVHNDEEQNPKMEIWTHINLASLSYDLKQIDSTQHHMMMAQKLVDLGKFATHELAYFYVKKAFLDMAFNDFHLASAQLDSVLKYPVPTPLKIKALWYKSYTERYIGNLYFSDVHLRKAANMDISRLVKHNKYQLGLIKMQYNLKEMEARDEKARANLMRNFVIILLALLLLMTGLFVYILKSRKDKKQLHNTLRTTELEKAEYKLKHDVVAQQVININGTNNHWEAFLISFNARHPLYIDKLRAQYDWLTPTDISNCICLFEQRNVAETAELLNVTDSAVKKARKRLREKFEVTDTEQLKEILQTASGNPIHAS